MAKSPISSDTQGLSRAVYEELQRLRDLIRSDTVKREMWGNRFTAADRRKFSGPEREVLRKHHTIELWHIARGTPTPNQCIVEVAYAVGLLNDSRSDSLLDALGAKPRAGKLARPRSAAVPHWDEDARGLVRGEVLEASFAVVAVRVGLDDPLPLHVRLPREDEHLHRLPGRLVIQREGRPVLPSP